MSQNKWNYFLVFGLLNVSALTFLIGLDKCNVIDNGSKTYMTVMLQASSPLARGCENIN